GQIEPLRLVPGKAQHLRHRSEEHTSELQSLRHHVCRLLLEKKNRPNHEAIISSIVRSTGKDVNSHTVLDGIITTIMATIQRINIIVILKGRRNPEIFTLSLHDALPIYGQIEPLRLVPGKAQHLRH